MKLKTGLATLILAMGITSCKENTQKEREECNETYYIACDKAKSENDVYMKMMLYKGCWCKSFSKSKLKKDTQLLKDYIHR